jgi:hypothetical protein
MSKVVLTDYTIEQSRATVLAALPAEDISGERNTTPSRP